MSYNVFWKKIRWDKGNSSQKRLYYTSGEYLRYITRQEAACKCKNLDAKLHNHDNVGDIKSETINQYESSLFNHDGFYTREQEKELHKKFKNLDNENIVYDTVITFQPEFAEKYQLFTPEKMQEIVARNLRKMLKNSQFDYDNIEWFATFHTNTNNPHVHLGFFEKEPKHYNKKTGKFEYTCYADMEKEFINDQAKNIEYYVEQENSEFYAWRNTEREQLVQLTWANVKNIHDEVNNYNNQFINKYNDLFNQFKNYKNKGGKNQGYNDLPEELKFSVIDFTKCLITNDAILSERYNEFVSEMNSRQEWLVKAAILNGDDGQHQSQFVEKTMNDPKNGVHSRMYNAVVDILKRDYKKDRLNLSKRFRTGGTESRRTNQNIMGYNKQLTIRSSFYKLLNSMEKQFDKAKQSSVETFWKMDQQLQDKAKYEATKIYQENTQYNNNNSKIYKQKNQFKFKK